MIEDKKTFVFDMDGTLSECREKPVYPKNKMVLKYLMLKGKNVLIVSAGSCKRVLNQLNATGVLVGKIYILGNYGLDCATVINGKVVEEQKLSYKKELNEENINNCFDKFRKKYGLENYFGKSHVLFDSGLIAFSFLGTDAPQKLKRSFDPNQSKRLSYIKSILNHWPDNYTAHIAGQTSIDILKKSYDKHSAILRWALEQNCQSKDIIFFGDEITKPYGNDSSILNGGIDYVEVKNYKEVANHFNIKQLKNIKNNNELNF